MRGFEGKDLGGFEMEDLVTPHRATVMILVPFYLPGSRGGGPIRSVSKLVESLGSEQHLLVLTADRDLGSDRPYPGVQAGVFQLVGKGSVRYLAPREGGRALRRILRSTPHDVLYMNSFFSYRFTILPLALRRIGAIRKTPVIVAPRGEFSPGALGLKASKKRLWLSVSRFLGIYRGVLWHATTEDEADLIRSIIGDGERIFVARQLLGATEDEDPGQVPSREEKRPGSARIVFLSRISPKKNLTSAISLVASVERGSIEFDIYGPVDDKAYWRECQRMISGSPGTHISIRYRGELAHAEVSSVLSRYDLFLFPTLGENFGHVVVEAMAAGCPVAVSDRTPWGQIQEAGAGWVLPLDDRRAWKAAIEEVVEASEDSLDVRRTAAKRLARASISGQEDVDAYRRLFLAEG